MHKKNFIYAFSSFQYERFLCFQILCFLNNQKQNKHFFYNAQQCIQLKKLSGPLNLSEISNSDQCQIALTQQGVDGALSKKLLK